MLSGGTASFLCHSLLFLQLHLFCFPFSFPSSPSSLPHHFPSRVLSVIQGSSSEVFLIQHAETSHHLINSTLFCSLLFYPPNRTALILSLLSLLSMSLMSHVQEETVQLLSCLCHLFISSSPSSFLLCPLPFSSSLLFAPLLSLLISSRVPRRYFSCCFTSNSRPLILSCYCLPILSFLLSSFTSLLSSSFSHLSNLPQCHFKHIINKTTLT